MQMENLGHIEVPRKFMTPESVMDMYETNLRKKVADGMPIHEAAKTILEKDLNQHNDDDQIMVLKALEKLRLEIAPHELPFIIEDIDTSTGAQTVETSLSQDDLPPPPKEINIVI